MKKNEQAEHEIFNSENDVPDNQESGIALVDTDQRLELASIDNIDDLDSAEVAPIELSYSYWSPVNAGEAKRVIFHKIAPTRVMDQSSGEMIDLESAFFLTKDEHGVAKVVVNGSKRLVGQLVSNKIVQGTPLLITYKGKVRNKTNSFLSDDFAINPLILNR